MAPILPGISDRPEQMRAVVEAALDAGASHVSPIMLHLRPGVREEFWPWLEQEHPELVERYADLYRKPYGPKAERDALSSRVHRIIDRTPRRRDALAPRFRRPRRPQQQEAEQLSMW
jgi:DNA repair photolyase